MPSLRDRLASIRRDVATVLGRTPPPLVKRTTPRRASTAASARPLIVREVRRETADATVIVLADPTGAPIRFVPGQFLTLQVTIDGAVHRRAYSICSDSLENDTVAVCAKRIAGGKVSTYLHERLRAGDVIPVLGPSGEFTVPLGATNLVCIAGGSGITPILAIVRAILRDPSSRVTLVYGNQGEIIFARELDALAAAHPGFTLRHVPWLGADAIETVDGADYFVCGPLAAMTEVRAALVARGVEAGRIHEERFATPERSTAPRSPQLLTVQGRTTTVAPDATLLDAALAAGIDLPFSCAMGGCGACAVTLVSGSVDLDEPNCLSADERARGRILTCVARPSSPCTLHP